MDLYISSLVLGAAGLGTMALGGLGIRGHAGGHQAGHAGGHAPGHTLAPGAAHGAAHTHFVANPLHAGAKGGARGGARGGPRAGGAGALRGSTMRDAATNAAWTIASPRFLFSIALGLGAVGELTRPLLSGPLHLAAAIVGGVLFERFLVSPLWNFSMRFASTPAVTLESAVTDEATAVTSFDANGQGIISVEVDGQIVQVLATLRPDDRRLGGARIRAGQRVRIEDVDAGKNCCTVSLI